MPSWTTIREQGGVKPIVEIVSATRMSGGDFWNRSPLGWSLRRLSYDTRVTSRIAVENKQGLSDIYNERIDAADHHDILVFMHDDVWIDDIFLADRLLDGLAEYDVIGVAGNRRRVPNQPAWAFLDRVDGHFVRDLDNISGAVAHGDNPLHGMVAGFGEAPAECELLDGLFLAAKASTLRERQVRFDPQFDFHFYDMDFCRSARAAGLRLGTWPIGLTHRSGGAFGSEQWTEKYRAYLAKWEDPTSPPAWLTK